MTHKQQEKLDQLENALGVIRGTLQIRGESEGYVFAEVQGVTVLIARKSRNPRGGYKLPAVRTYPETVEPTNLDAVLRPKELFERQKPDPERTTGHLGPLVNTDWKCGNRACRCGSESYEQRKKRSIG